MWPIPAWFPLVGASLLGFILAQRRRSGPLARLGDVTEATAATRRRRTPWGLLWLAPSWLVLAEAHAWWTVFRTWNDFGDSPEWNAAFDRLRTTVTIVAVATAVLALAVSVGLWHTGRHFAWSIPAITVLGLAAMWFLTLEDATVVDSVVGARLPVISELTGSAPVSRADGAG